MTLPSRLTLPSGAVVELSAKDDAEPRAPDPDAPLFGEVLALFDDGDVELTTKGARVDVRSLPPADFHVLRGVLTKAGLAREEPVETTFINCGGPLDVAPCAGPGVGRWRGVHGEAGPGARLARLQAPWIVRLAPPPKMTFSSSAPGSAPGAVFPLCRS